MVLELPSDECVHQIVSRSMLIRYVMVNAYTYRGNNSDIFPSVSNVSRGQLFTQLHSEQPKLYGVLVILSAIG